MKKPVSPPNFGQLLKKHSKDLPKILQAVIQPTQGHQYCHWDTLRQLKPPNGLSAEQWWLGIKMARQFGRRNLPLKDTRGRPFWYSMADVVLELTHQIDSKASGRIEIAEPVTNPDTRDRYIFMSLVEEAITSSQLEGASTTRQVAADMIRYGRRPRDRSEQMIANNWEAINEIRKLKDTKLAPSVVLDLHKILVEGTLDDPTAEGRIQDPSEKRVEVVDQSTHEVLHIPPPAKELPKRLDAMCKFANHDGNGKEFIHPIIRAIGLHFWLAYDHPFLDGNGRTARALFYWAMLSQGYWLFEYISISRILNAARSEYARSYLFTENDDNDLTYFIIYQLEVIVRAIGDLEKFIEKKVKQVQNVEKKLKAATRFNHRQLALLSHALRHPRAEYSIKSHQNSHSVAYATARSDLFDLVDAGLLTKHQRGRRELSFIPVGNLEAKLGTV